MARVIDPRRRVVRDIGPFADGLQATLAHDRVAIACAGRGIRCGGQRVQLQAAFYHTETAFLQRWEGDICDAVEKGTYEKSYAKFLMAGYNAALRVDDDGEQVTDDGDALIAKCVGDGEVIWGDIEEFFLDRAEEIGEEALKVKGDGKLLRIRFVEMHRNKALCPEWRHNYRIQMQQQQQQMQIKQQQQQQGINNQQQQQQQPQIQMTQEQHQEQIQMMQQQQRLRQQQFQQQQMMIQKQRQQQMMMAQQQQQQYLDDGATLQAKHDCSSS
jgi:flagellar biosynthesis GTPase FlhF